MTDFRTSKTSKFSVLEPLAFRHVVPSDSDSSSDSGSDSWSDRSDEEDVCTMQQNFMETIIPSSTYEEACNLSKIERRKKECKGNLTLTYGEILFDSFRDAILPIFEEYGGLPRGAKFYDLGSGRGRASFFVTLLADDYYHTRGHLASCTGVEIIASLHALSVDALGRWNQHYPQYLSSLRGGRYPECVHSSGEGSGEEGSGVIQNLHGSITDLQCVNWTDGDLVFVNSTCFTGAYVFVMFACISCVCVYICIYVCVCGLLAAINLSNFCLYSLCCIL
jgi:hypothetical protein